MDQGLVWGQGWYGTWTGMGHGHNNKKLMLLSQMIEHKWFEGTLSEMA